MTSSGALARFIILFVMYFPMGVDPTEEETCLVDSCSSNIVLREIKYFQTLTNREENVLTIAGRDAIIVGSGRATIVLPMGKQITIEEALLHPDATRTS